MPTATITKPDPVLAVERAIEVVGGITSAAAMLGVSGPTVHEWKSGKSKVPFVRAIQLERLSYGAVRAEEFRPDLTSEIQYLRGTKRQRRAHHEVA
jgi:DNA-binding transcriptional regulator YdaS (Cro superfamily)